MMPDTVITIGGSTVQHGPLSNRVYVIRLDPADLPHLIDDLEDLAEQQGYTKIFAKVPASVLDVFAGRGYVVEATVPRLFRGREDGFFVSLFRDPVRAQDDRTLETVLASPGTTSSCSLPPGARFSLASSADAPAIAALFRDIFATYPFPIQNEAYIEETMAHDIRYFCVHMGRKLAAVSSADMHLVEGNVEMTDFATRPEFRGLGLSTFLLSRMEEAMRRAGIDTAYTIARAASQPINLIFARAGYTFGGTLINNTGISGGLESMHVWYMPLQDQ